MNWRHVLGYFREPFPRAEGFSSYRPTGPSAHVLLMGLIVALGCALCLQTPDTQPLLMVWGIVAIYIGRDVSVVAHAPLFPVVLAMLVLILFFPEYPVAAYRAIAAHARDHPETAVLATAVVGSVQLVLVALVARGLSRTEGS